jgi:hypothetical protein
VAQPIVRITMDPSWPARLDVPLARIVNQLAREIGEDIVRAAPVERGTLARSVQVRGNRVYVTAPHWHFVEYGTRPHRIFAKAGSALWWPGARHPVKMVRHPGTKAQPFIRPAAYKQRRLQVALGGAAA